MTSIEPSPGDRPKSLQRSPLLVLATRYRNPVSVLAHAVLFAFSLFAAFGLAYNFHGIGAWFTQLYLPLLALAVPAKILVFWRLRLFEGSWRYVGLRDLIAIGLGSQVGSFVFVFIYFLIETLHARSAGGRWLGHTIGLRQSVFLIDWAATIGVVCAARVVWRLHYESKRRSDAPASRRVLIIGAGDHAENLVRELLRNPASDCEIVGLIDDRIAHLKHRIHDVAIIGRTHQIKELCDQYEVDEILLANPDARPGEVRKIIDLCQGEALQFRTIPPLTDLVSGRVQVSQLRPVSIEDLLGRDPVALDIDAVGRQLSGRRIVVTGAGGSIGSEMCRQIVRFRPERLILIERAENNLFEIHRELLASNPEVKLFPEIADICDERRIRNLLAHHRASTVFHAAAHKHVPMMEHNVSEAIKNNVVGTRTVVLAAAAEDVEKFVMISTDKAVNPTSVMGCTKRVAELYVQHLNGRSKLQLVTVRFGNVLGSSGSVIPIFRQQIAKGGPVTVTHPDMTRFFMTIPEASQLVLQAGTMGNGGEIYVLDMGDPVKIVDLAHNMITLSGLRPGEDIEIVFTGTRPGEKLFEELLIAGEDVSATSHPKIGIWRYRPEDWKTLVSGIDTLIDLVDSATTEQIREHLKRIVPEYQPAAGGFLGPVMSQPRTETAVARAD